ncbi:FadR/GntR family transcriptional regulator [Paenibacillus yanchengensis]|uniref:FadR/GntR family transcriptional regulator n=1 Tax=Paenibacillus yanchengensis TaxID=2035833 RepID=A0ABW4YNN4_9BACL
MTNMFNKPPKGSEYVMEHLKQEILSGKYKPGEKLPTVVQFAARYQVGRSTIREALSALKAIGMLHIQHGGGTYVADSLSQSKTQQNVIQLFSQTIELREILEVRQYIEAGCAHYAAIRRTDEDLERLWRILTTMQQHLSDEIESEQADIDFHLTLAHASHNSLFIAMMESIATRLKESMRDTRKLWFFADQNTAEALYEEHLQIYNAIAQQNTTQTALLITDHLQKVNQVILRLTP